MILLERKDFKYLLLVREMKKSLVILFAIVFSMAYIGGVLADSNDTASIDKVEKAYSCLEGKVKGNCGDLNVEEQAFSLLALSYDENIQAECRKAIDTDRECWGTTSTGTCKIRSTALSLLAMNNLGLNTEKQEKWLLKQNKTDTSLEWYLEIDTNEDSSCSVSYDGNTYGFNLMNGKASNNAGSCLISSQNGFWFRVTSSCYEKQYTVTCNKPFASAFLYKKTNSETVYVSSQTSAGSADGSVDMRINSECFIEDSKCSYEGSLWAALALHKRGYDLSPLIPYLIAMSSDNEKYLPNSFLYILLTSDDYLTKLLQQQTPQGYWQATDTKYNKFYDTGLGVLALYGLNSEDLEKARTYLINAESSDGCWQGSVRDTALVLWAGWSRVPSNIPGSSGTNEYCRDAGFDCVPSSECQPTDRLNNYYCSDISNICCRNVARKSCSEMNGEICPSGKTCSASTAIASDTAYCCTEGCIAGAENECLDSGYSCRNVCYKDEEEKNYYCSGGDICCGEAAVVKKSGSLGWIVFFLIILVLVVLGIIYREKVKLWIFKIKGKFKKGPAPRPTRPSFRPGSPPTSTSPLGFFKRAMPQRPAPKGRTRTDIELEETMKKLRDMGK